MLIKIDNREKDLISQIKLYIENVACYSHLQISIETLPLGDVILSNNNIDLLVIERKSIQDLLASIKDGRYEEQSYRLNGMQHHNHNIIYLIEGDINKINRFKDSKSDNQLLHSAIISLNYYKGFSVIRTFSLDETALFICNITKKIEKCIGEKRLPFYSNNVNVNVNVNEMHIDNQKNNTNNLGNITSVINIKNIQEIQHEELMQQHNNELNSELTQEQNEKEYINVVKKVKKENITPNNISEIMLCQIPGISSITAVAIISKFKNIQNLLQCINADKNCLNDITYVNAKGQVRKITKTSTENIIKFLFP